ncbi:hypothetical protein C4568_03570 [Candidatus Parcubacteria bacterium]|nr:MAG: hypothetical protein C4568_03570 [Candidatus Parcubacteria bacterium]
MKKLLTLFLALALLAPHPAYALLLDDVAGATFAFSLSRYLKTAFEGSSVVRLRESATAGTQDFKLNGSNVLVTNDVNEYTVTQWLALTSATTSYVVSVYDHTGNGNTFTAPAGINEPVLTEGTSLNSLAAIDFSASSEYRLEATTLDIGSANPIEIFGLTRSAGSFSATDRYLFSNGAVSLAAAAVDLNNFIWQADLGENILSANAPVVDTNYQLSYRYDGTSNFIINVNCTEEANQVNAGGPADWRTAGTDVIGNSASTAADRLWGGLIAELIVFKTAYSAGDVTNIQTSMGTQGNITGCAAAPAADTPSLLRINGGTWWTRGGSLIIR